MEQKNYPLNTKTGPGLIVWDHDGTLVNTELRSFALFPGIAELLLDLKNIGFELSIWTARPRNSTIESIKRLEIAEFFGEIYCYDDGPSKPNPSGLQKVSDGWAKNKIIHIGDSMSDLEGARAFGVDVIGACWYSSRNLSEFKKLSPLTAMKVDDCRAIIASKFKVEL